MLQSGRTSLAGSRGTITRFVSMPEHLSRHVVAGIDLMLQSR